MEFDHSLLYNFASVIAAFLFVSAAGVTIIRKLKLRWPITVNCWFCNNDTKIYHGERDWWKCPTCEQYNGFTKDGDYAYNIPEQNMQLQNSFATRDTLGRKVTRTKGNGLCKDCNKNEEIKISELQKFEPSWFFDSGLRKFKRQLESRYPLCYTCQNMVDNVLQKQSRWLTRYKMLFFKEKAVGEIVHNAKKLDKIVRVFLTMLTSAIMYYPTYWPLPFVGAFLQTGAFVVNQAQKRTLDAILTLLWICISMVGPLNELNLLNQRITNEWPQLQHIREYHFITFLTLIIGFTNVTSRYRNTRSFKASFKKLESPVNNKIISTSPILDNSFEDFERSDTFDSSAHLNYRQSPVDFETPLPKAAPLFTIDSRERGNQESSSPGLFSKNISTDSTETGRRHILSFDGNSEQYSLNDSLSTLKTLTLGETQSRQSRKIPRIFKTKVYGSTSPDLFQRSFKLGTRKFILAPPKLKSPAQTSWVAGGYWQVGAEPPSLSRSSSQSSGFGSAGSNFGPSREPSVNKEIDKCSVVSDVTPCCYTPRPNSVNSMISCCQHGSHIQFSRCDSPVYNQPLHIVPNSLYVNNHQQSHFSPVHPEPNGCSDRRIGLQNQNINASILQQSQQVPNFNTGYPTVLTSPVWLPVLLCGSLVFNIAVFCTVLLR